MTKLPGFYVRGVPFGNRVNQAVARARFLSDEHHTAVTIEQIDGNGGVSVFRIVYPQNVAPPSLLLPRQAA